MKAIYSRVTDGRGLAKSVLGFKIEGWVVWGTSWRETLLYVHRLEIPSRNAVGGARLIEVAKKNDSIVFGVDSSGKSISAGQDRLDGKFVVVGGFRCLIR